MIRLSSLIALLITASCGLGAQGGYTPPTPDLATPSFYSDFSSQPIIDSGAPSNAPSLFSIPGNPSGGPCLIEPNNGSLIPNNWLRMRFRLIAPLGENLFEIRLHTDNQTNDLVVYTIQTTWTMPGSLWQALAMHSADRSLTISVRGAQLAGGVLTTPPYAGMQAIVKIAPVSADGTIVYWATTGTSVFKGFSIGEETVHDVLRTTQATSGTQCFGCHASTPDGLYVSFSQATDLLNGDPASIGIRSVNGLASEPTYLTPSGRALLARVSQQAPTFSSAHYSPSDRIAVVAYPNAGTSEIIWTDLEAKSQQQGIGWGVFARTGDSSRAGSPAFSHAGTLIAYTSSPGLMYGTVSPGDGDIRIVPYNNRQGGVSMPLAGASDPKWNEYYPSYSPDDSMIAFTRVPAGESSYDNRQAEVFVLPASGGTPTRLTANDSLYCSGEYLSPGATNSWPKWSPQKTQVGLKTYYWITFSSRRRKNIPQLFVAGIVVENGIITTYPALYLWNQPASESNHTAAWDVFRLIVG